MKRTVGDWVDGERFFHRDDDSLFLKEALQGGTKVLLIDQRRTGKTSLVRELLEDWPRVSLGLPPTRLNEGGR